eukprot:6121368-Prorocentrum_lima.AAC.1
MAARQTTTGKHTKFIWCNKKINPGDARVTHQRMKDITAAQHASFKRTKLHRAPPQPKTRAT